MANALLDQFTSPGRKLLPFFISSRDKWKAKHHELKKEAKLLSNQVRAVEASREQWRERATAAERRAAELERQIEELKFHGDTASSR
jgi:phage-related minor tail protein